MMASEYPADRVQIFASLSAYPAARVWIFSSIAAYPASWEYPADRE